MSRARPLARVRYPSDTLSRVIGWTIAGVIAGVFASLSWHRIHRLTSEVLDHLHVSARWPADLAPIILFVVVCAILALRSRRPRAAALVVGAWTASAIVAVFLAGAFTGPASSVSTAFGRDAALFPILLIIVAVAAALGAGAQFLFGLLRAPPIVQDGSRCWTCGHDISASRATGRCAECGAEIGRDLLEPERERTRRARALRRRRAVGGAILVVIGVLVVARHAQLIVRGRAEFEASFGSLQPARGVWAGPMVFWVGGVTIDFVEALLIEVSIDETAGLSLLVSVPIEKGDAQPAMRLQLMGANNFGGGAPAIIADLSPSQAEWVRAHGIPKALSDRFLERAEAVGWVPTAPGWSPQVIEIDASEFIPAENRAHE